jgi:hypothetical protein
MGRHELMKFLYYIHHFEVELKTDSGAKHCFLMTELKFRFFDYYPHLLANFPLIYVRSIILSLLESFVQSIDTIMKRNIH